MQINQISSTTYNPNPTSNIRSNLSKKELIQPKNTINDCLKQKYDVTNMSFNELCEVADILHKNKEISGIEHAFITFDPTKSPNKLGFENNYFMTAVSSNGKRNWVEEFPMRFQRDAKQGNVEGYNINKKIHTVLTKMLIYDSNQQLI